MAKAKVMTIKNWEKMLEVGTQTHTMIANGQEFEIDVTPTISWDDAATIVDTVATIVFNEENGEYHPEVTEALLRAEVLEKYAHFTLPKSFDKIYQLVYGTDTYDFVAGVINTDQLMSIEEGIYETIQYKLNVLSGGVQAEIQKVMDAFETFNENAKDMFDGVNKEDLNSFVKNVAAMPEALDEEKVVQLVHAANKKESEK